MDELTSKQRLYVQHIASGMESRAAAKAAGYSDSFAKVAGHRMKRNQSVIAANEANEAALRAKTLYTQEKAVKEIDDMIKKALEAKNPAFMAATGLLTLKCKVHGFVRDKVEVEYNVNLKSALIEARSRIFPLHNVTPGPDLASASALLTAPQPATVPNPAETLADGGKAWRPFSGD